MSLALMVCFALDLAASGSQHPCSVRRKGHSQVTLGKRRKLKLTVKTTLHPEASFYGEG